MLGASRDVYKLGGFGGVTFYECRRDSLTVIRSGAVSFKSMRKSKPHRQGATEGVKSKGKRTGTYISPCFQLTFRSLEPQEES